MPRRQLDGLRGSKYPGNGISGNSGRARYASLLRWLGKHLYDVVGDRRTMGIIKERRVYLSSLVGNMVEQKKKADQDTLAGLWVQQAKKNRKKRKRIPTEEDEFMLRLTAQTFSQDFGAAVVVSDVSDVLLAGSSDSQPSDSQHSIL